MPSIEEAIASKPPLASDLAAGVEQISAYQEITFQRYRRVILPIDGYVFWVKDQLVAPSAAYNDFRFSQNGLALNANAPQGAKAYHPKSGSTLTIKGSLHYATDTRQDETETFAMNRVVFTALQRIQDLNEIDPDTLYLATYDGIRFAFSTRGKYYQQADLHHYVGDAVYADMATQIIDDARQFDTSQVVSNSLPIWLSLNGYRSTIGVSNPVRLYPSYLLPNNLSPPYGAVHVLPDSTTAIAAAPTLSKTGSHDQLVRETVRVTLYGLRNFNAMDFVDCVNDFSLNFDTIGIMNMPTIRDEKRTQSELNAIAMKKSIQYDVNYYQSTARDVARQLITSAVPSIIIRD